MYTVVHGCTRLHMTAHCCSSMYMAVQGCTMLTWLYKTVYGCISLYKTLQGFTKLYKPESKLNTRQVQDEYYQPIARTDKLLMGPLSYLR